MPRDDIGYLSDMLAAARKDKIREEEKEEEESKQEGQETRE
jgi:hypothetical protein